MGKCDMWGEEWSERKKAPEASASEKIGVSKPTWREGGGMVARGGG